MRGRCRIYIGGNWAFHKYPLKILLEIRHHGPKIFINLTTRCQWQIDAGGQNDLKTRIGKFIHQVETQISTMKHNYIKE